MFVARLFTPLLVAWLVCFAGCGSGEGLVPVGGVVTLDSKPLPGVQVTFDQPELGPNENKGYMGRTDAAGRYSLKPIGEDVEGARPGKYRVILTTAVIDPTQPAPAVRPSSVFGEPTPVLPPERIPPAYRGGKLTYPVPPDGTDAANFELKSK